MTHSNGRPQSAPLVVQPLQVMVRSETDPAQAYKVQLAYCPCLDFHFRGRLCKHIVAAYAAMGLELPA